MCLGRLHGSATGNLAPRDPKRQWIVWFRWALAPVHWSNEGGDDALPGPDTGQVSDIMNARNAQRKSATIGKDGCTFGHSARSMQQKRFASR